MISGQSQGVAEKAKRIYDERLRGDLELLYREKYVAIEPASGDYFLGDTIVEAAISK